MKLEGNGTWSVKTLNSVYHVRKDDEGWKARRTIGRNAPTPNTGTDGQWQDAEHVEILPNGAMYIMWDWKRGTLTSKVSEVLPIH